MVPMLLPGTAVQKPGAEQGTCDIESDSSAYAENTEGRTEKGVKRLAPLVEEELRMRPGPTRVQVVIPAVLPAFRPSCQSAVPGKQQRPERQPEPTCLVFPVPVHEAAR